MWSATSLRKRVLLIKNLSRTLRSHHKHLSHIITQEMGKPIKQSQAEINKCILLSTWCTKHAIAILRETKAAPPAPSGYISYQPMGTIFGIMPWNFPFWQVFRFAIPTLLTGNTVLIKHAPNVLLAAQALETIFLQAGIPPGVYQNLVISETQCKKVIAQVQGISLTGSRKAGAVIASLAGKHIKKCLMELGGSDPYIILNDADLSKASICCVSSRMNNNGQSCIAAKRWIVTNKVSKRFTQLVIEKIQKYKMGNPFLEDTTLGPLARSDLRKTLHRQVKALVKRGGRLLVGGYIPKNKGFFYPPTILRISKTLAMQKEALEELFGPVAILIPVDNEAEAIKVANSLPLRFRCGYILPESKKS